MLLVVWLGALAACSHNTKANTPAPVTVARVQEAITATTADYLRRVFNHALRHQAQAVVVVLDTPGGGLEPTQTIVELFRESPLPVVVYIAPRGARAGSAGVLLTLAAHRAYMAPETVLGAATPVSLSDDAEMDPMLQAKITNLVAAQARALARRRGNTAARLAEAMVREARTVDVHEARAVGLVDGLAVNLEDLLAQLDGQTVAVAERSVTLRTRTAPVDEVQPLPLERVLAWLTHPSIVLLLLSIGAQLLFIEFSSPGGWVAGTLGVVSLGLGLYGLGILPSNGLGLVFLLLAFILFVLEVKAPTHGALALAGGVSFMAGGWILFNTRLTLPHQRLSPWWSAALALGMAGGTMLVWRLLRAAEAQPVLTGPEAVARLVGHTAWARTALVPGQRGSVQVGGETWSARLVPGATPVAAGQPVRVVARQGLVLLVAPLEDEDPVAQSDTPSEAEA